MLSYLQNIFFRPRTDPNVSVSQHAFVVKHTQAKQMVKINLGVLFVCFKLINSSCHFAATCSSPE